MTHEKNLAEWDAKLTGNGGDRWDAFYENRAKPCPFFVAAPDESLAQWVGEGTIPAGKALDLGCGNGRNAVFLARSGFAVEGVDLSQTALAWAREQAAAAGVEIALRNQSVFDIALSPASYDLVYDSGLFHHIAPHRRKGYVELVAHALKPSGWFGLTCFRPEGGSGYTDHEVYERRSLGGGLGYTAERLRDIWGEQLQVRVVRQMEQRDAASGTFGQDFLWVLLAQSRRTDA